ncbi:uncharacterized protein involved in response to NO [Variovorax sp. YR216]|nr:uncharacterized protein involved in response to NO [Variovorax sp. YR216]
MADLLKIQEPDAVPTLPPQWSAFLELGFRPLYIAGCFWAAVSVALWVFVPELLKGRMPGVFWISPHRRAGVR